jgi:hypothetical protein
MFLGSRARPLRKADNFTAICDCLDNVEFSSFHNPVCLPVLLRGQLYFFICRCSHLTGTHTYGPPRPVTGKPLILLYFNESIYVL